MKKILCITRVSTTEQDLESQKQELIDFCKSKGFVEDEMEFIEAKGASARKENDEYKQFLADIKNIILTTPSIRTVALWHLNRLGRVKKCLTDMENFFVNNKVQMYVKNGFDMPLLNAEGKETTGASIAFSVYSAMVEVETEEMFAKVSRGRRAKIEQGIWAGGQIKIGYKLNESRRYILDEDESALVRLIFELYATAKYSIYTLRDELMSRGYTIRGNKLSFATLRNILADKSYYDGTKAPIIDKELFEKCDAVKNNQVAVKRTKESRNVNFAVGLLRCECGHNYIATGDFYTCFAKKRSPYHPNRICTVDSPIVRREVIDGLLWFVTKRLQQAFLMAKDNASIEEYRSRERVLQLKISTLNKELDALVKRLDELEEERWVSGMPKAKYDKFVAAIQSKQQQIQGQLKNLSKEQDEVAAMINQLELPTNDKYMEALLLSDLDTEQIEDRKRIKDMMFQHISDITLQKHKEGKKMWLDINIISKNGLVFPFVYNIWLNTFRKEECCVFYEGKPLYSKDGNIITLNEEVQAMIRAKIGLPELTDMELGIAARNHINREMGIKDGDVAYYTFNADVLSAKESMDIDGITSYLSDKYELSEDEIAFIADSADTFEVGTPSDKVKAILDRLIAIGLAVEGKEDIIPLSLGGMG